MFIELVYNNYTTTITETVNSDHIILIKHDLENDFAVVLMPDCYVIKTTIKYHNLILALKNGLIKGAVFISPDWSKYDET